MNKFYATQKLASIHQAEITRHLSELALMRNLPASHAPSGVAPLLALLVFTVLVVTFLG